MVIADDLKVEAVVVHLNMKSLRETYLNQDTNLIDLDLSNLLMNLDNLDNKVGEEEVEVEGEDSTIIRTKMEIINLEITCHTNEPNPMIKMI